MQYPAAVVSQHQEYVQHLKPNGWHREEVDRYHTFDVILQERPPGLRRWLAASRHIFANAGFADVDAEFEEFAVDARRSPKRVLAAHSPNQLSNLFGHRWTPGLTTTNLPRPEQPKPLRCQPITVSGLTTTRADRQSFQNWHSCAQRNRSAAVNLGRFTDRCSTPSWCRRARISS